MNLKFWKKETETEEVDGRSEIQKRIDECVESLGYYHDQNDIENYERVLGDLKELVKLRDALGDTGETVEETFLDKLKGIAAKVFGAIIDPRVIVAGITSAVYVWWGKTCMEYDSEGNIPPNRMMSNGPKAPKQ